MGRGGVRGGENERGRRGLQAHTKEQEKEPEDRGGGDRPSCNGSLKGRRGKTKVKDSAPQMGCRCRERHHKIRSSVTPTPSGWTPFFRQGAKTSDVRSQRKQGVTRARRPSAAVMSVRTPRPCGYGWGAARGSSAPPETDLRRDPILSDNPRWELGTSPILGTLLISSPHPA